MYVGCISQSFAVAIFFLLLQQKVCRVYDSKSFADFLNFIFLNRKFVGCTSHSLLPQYSVFNRKCM